MLQVTNRAKKVSSCFLTLFLAGVVMSVVTAATVSAASSGRCSGAIWAVFPGICPLSLILQGFHWAFWHCGPYRRPSPQKTAVLLTGIKKNRYGTF